jgi:hypothetical protein
MGPRWRGNYAAEPATDVKIIEIRREQLSIDLRPLVSRQPANVDVIYDLYNPSDPKPCHLVFVSGTANIDEFEVRYEDRLVPSQVLPATEVHRRLEEMPSTWKPPGLEDLPGIKNRHTLVLFSQPEYGLSLVTFSLQIRSGRSAIRARYRTRIPGTEEGYPTATWQFLYILGPARAWGKFGGLDVEVQLPDGWESASVPHLNREDSCLRGSFAGLPGDYLIVSTRLPVGPGFSRRVAFYSALHVLSILSGGLLCWLAGRWTGRLFALAGANHRASDTLREVLLWMFAVVSGIGWGALIYASDRTLKDGIAAGLGEQESPNWDQRWFVPTCATFLAMLLSVPFGVLITSRAALRAWKKRSKCLPNEVPNSGGSTGGGYVDPPQIS